jgi:glycerophosphoryl diester phosphodiesterase
MWIFAHRGAAADRRTENTIPAFRTALGLGADLESDARLSRDRQVVLIHDAWYRVGWLPLPVRWQRADRLARGGAPTIDALFDALATAYRLSLDLKDSASAAPLIDAAARRDATGSLWLVSDRVDLLVDVRRSDSTVHLVHEARRRDIPDRNAHASRLSDEGIDAMNTDALDWDQALVDHVHRVGVLAFGSLANDRIRLERARSLGLDGVYTDDITLAQQAVGR